MGIWHRHSSSRAFSRNGGQHLPLYEHGRRVQESSHMDSDVTRQQIARKAKAIVALAFRNGPIEDVHAGQPCPTCTGCQGFSRITDDEMKLIMKNAVDQVYALLVLKAENSQEYEFKIRFGERYTASWDDPEKPRSPCGQRIKRLGSKT